jgi:hypothetical protein
MAFSARRMTGSKEISYFIEGVSVVIVSGEWKVGSEFTGAWFCYWDMEGEKQQQCTCNGTLRSVRVITLPYKNQ